MGELSRCGGGVTPWAIDSTWSFLSLWNLQNKKILEQNVTQSKCDSTFFWTYKTEICTLTSVWTFNFDSKSSYCFVFSPVLAGVKYCWTDHYQSVCLSTSTLFFISFSFPSHFFAEVYTEFSLRASDRQLFTNNAQGQNDLLGRRDKNQQRFNQNTVFQQVSTAKRKKERKKEKRERERERERMIEFAQREVILISNTPSRFIKLLNCVSLPLVQTPHLLFNVGSFSNFFKLK